jgi:GT2 family glycosyltransferase
MRFPSRVQLGFRLTNLLLGARVHLDAFCKNPWPYLQGVGWRMRGLRLRARHRFSALTGHSPRAYALWIETREHKSQAAIALGGNQDGCGQLVTPSITVVIDCRANGDGLLETLQSVADAVQATGAPDTAGTQLLLLGAYGNADLTRVAFVRLRDTRTLGNHLAAGLGDSFMLPWVLTLKPGDRLDRLALNAYRAAVCAQEEARLFYADDDMLDAEGHRCAPHFKPQWNAELARYHDYLTDSCLFACDPHLIDEDWPQGAFPAQGTPVHVPYVLHHRRARPAPINPTPLSFASPAEIAGLPNVSVIVPTRDQAKLLRTCMAGLATTRYPFMDITVIDNDSVDAQTHGYLSELAANGVRVLRHSGAFNYAAMHNEAVASTRGPLLCLLNNDIEIGDPDWLRAMVVNALRNDVGAVGARLLYPDHTIQHAGIVTGIGGGAGHAHRFQPDHMSGYFNRAHLPQFVSAVTAACLVVARDRFQAVGGFDAENFAVAFNDVDLCLKLNARGWQSFYEPRAVLIHHESNSRGADRHGEKKLRFASELAALKQIWRTDRTTDPYHHPELSPFSEQFVVRL